METEVLGVQRKKRNRYVVTIESNGTIQQIVIIAENTKRMTGLVNKLYGHLLIDKDGNEIDRITFEVVELGKHSLLLYKQTNPRRGWPLKKEEENNGSI